MQEIEFRIWLNKNNFSKKLITDNISRLKKIEREMNFLDLDMQFEKDRCQSLLAAFDNKGQNETMNSFGEPNLPIGKYYLSAYKYALKKYILYKSDI